MQGASLILGRDKCTMTFLIGHNNVLTGSCRQRYPPKPRWLTSVMSKLPGSLSPEGSSRSGLNVWFSGKVPWNLLEMTQGRG